MNATDYSQNDYRAYSELYHHGILGQKWGKRNGPPYPIDAADHSASEKKAGWRKSLEGAIDTNRRVSRATSAAKLESRINKLSEKNPTESRQAKIDKLTAKRDTKIADLSENELELGRRYMKHQRAADVASIAGLVVAGTPGMLVADLGYSIVNNFTKEGKKTNELAKKVIQENDERRAKKDSEVNQQKDTEIKKQSQTSSKPDKKSLLNAAKNEGRYDLDFLEVTGDDWSKSKTLSEYSKYLDDPEKYMTTSH